MDTLWTVSVLILLHSKTNTMSSGYYSIILSHDMYAFHLLDKNAPVLLLPCYPYSCLMCDNKK